MKYVYLLFVEGEFYSSHETAEGAKEEAKKHPLASKRIERSILHE